MGDLWLEVLAFFGDREARKTLNRRRGAKKGAETRRARKGQSMAERVAPIYDKYASDVGSRASEDARDIIANHPDAVKVWESDPRD